MSTTMQGATLTGITSIQAAGGISGGDTPGHIAATNTIAFGYTQGTAAYSYALNTALRNSGMTWLGYNYSWDYLNTGENSGTLSAKVIFANIGGSAVHTKNWTLGATESWQTVAGTETFADPMGVSNLASVSLSFTGKDSRFWAGYYGPQVRNPSLSVLYTFDACSANPLSSPTCAGYAEAYKAQQCTANPLSDSSCPGYANALKTQQCASNPLSDPTCPNYEIAQSQCLSDSLSNRLCEGYGTAYAIKYIVNLDPAVTNAVNQQLTTNNEIARNDPAKITVVNTTVDTVLSTPSTTSATATSPASVTSVVNQSTSVIASPASPVATAATAAVVPPPPSPAKLEERQQEQRKTDVEVGKVERKINDPKEIKREVGQRAKDIARDVAKANTMERQVASQGVLVGLIGYVPGFTGYQQAIVPDTNALDLAKKYSKPVVDNANAQRRLQGANDRLHNEMIESQYK